MPTTLPSSVLDVFVAFEQCLLNAGSPPYFVQSQVIISLDDDQFPQGPGPYVMICPEKFVNDQYMTEGAGRYCTIEDGYFSVYIWTRNREDIPWQDKWSLTRKNTAGILFLKQQIIDALHLCFPVDSNGNLLVAEPPRYNYSEKSKRSNKQSEWIGLRCVFDVSIQIALPSNL